MRHGEKRGILKRETESRSFVQKIKLCGGKYEPTEAVET